MMGDSIVILVHSVGSYRSIGRERWRSACTWEAPDEDLHLEDQSERGVLPSNGKRMHLTMKYQIEKQKCENIEYCQRYTRLNRRRENLDKMSASDEPKGQN